MRVPGLRVLLVASLASCVVVTGGVGEGLVIVYSSGFVGIALLLLSLVLSYAVTTDRRRPILGGLSRTTH